MKPQLPPLPLVDGHFLIDNSGLEKLKCPRLFQYTEVDRKTAVAAKAGANFGSTIHRGLETRYKLCGTEPVDSASELLINVAMDEWLRENPQPETDFRNYGHAEKMLRVYNSIYRKEAFKILKNTAGKPIIEASFALPLGSVQNIPIIYCGKIDLGIEDNNGIWSQDHKTAFQFGDTFDKQMSMDGGQLGYCWALGQFTGKQPQGYIIDAIRVRRPKRDDEFSDNGCIDATDFKRTPYFVSQDMLDEWKEDVLSLICNIINMHDRNYYPRFRANCTNKFGVCEFYDVCSTPVEQRERLLNSGMYEENTWTKGLKLDAEKQNMPEKE